MLYCTESEIATYTKFAELPLPRHTSYPPVNHWHDAWNGDAYAQQIEQLARSPAALGLYVHVPFCRQLCLYCGCTREIVPDSQRVIADPSEAYLAGLERELEKLHAVLGRAPLHSIHLGGGSPTFLSPAQLARLWRAIFTNFAVAPDAELSAEIDPRITQTAHLVTLRGLGFNRLSLGIQDFDEAVQKAIGRIQSVEQVTRTVVTARDLGFNSINFDLIYGLPWQTKASMTDTIEKVLALSPDRIAFYRLALLPDMFKWQKTFTRADLPSGRAALELMLLAIELFTKAGYEFIGLDHFAKPTEALSKARRQGSLTRTFQGMTTGRELATIGVGPSAITMTPQFFSQNFKTTKEWLNALNSGFPAEKGKVLTLDDRMTRNLLTDLYSYGRIDADQFFKAYGVPLRTYLSARSDALKDLETEGLIEPSAAGDIVLTPVLGRLLVRVVAAALDEYAGKDAWKEGITAGHASRAG